IWISIMNKENPHFEIKYQMVEQQVLATRNTVSIDNYRIIEKHQ
ncbi:46445_t:CDS:2, partial [Gigaspora margarita]